MFFLKRGHRNWGLEAQIQMDTNYFPCLGKTLEILSCSHVWAEGRCQNLDKCSNIMTLEKIDLQQSKYLVLTFTTF